MSPGEILQICLYICLLVAATATFGPWMARVLTGETTFLDFFLKPVERAVYRISGIDPEIEMNWKQYARAVLAFNFFGFVLVLLLMLFQGILPFNPAKLPNVPFPLALNTAISFMTNTNWQAYSGEAAMSYLTQMAGLGVQNFLSAATGVGVMLALIRGFVRREASELGNFWVDLVRSTLYILLPLSFALALVLVSQGVVQTFSSYVTATTLAGQEQIIPLGPAASQIAIKQLGTNGGGFFGVNSAHPFENPTPLSNFLEMFVILCIPAALTATYGKMVGSMRQGWTIFAAMMIVFLMTLGGMLWAEYATNPVFGTGALMEGKEMRLGVANSVLWGDVTTLASNGSVNAMHSSLSSLAGGIAILNMLLGEVIFGGVGSGLYGMLMFVLLTVFLAGLMVGRTPEYLGKKIEAFDIQMAMTAVLLPSACVLILTALGCFTEAGRASIANPGPHGLSEILYAFASMTNNNGSAFSGLNATTNFYTLSGSLAMLVGRFGVILPVLAIAGNMVTKKVTPASAGTFPTDGGLFVVLLVAVVLIVGALTFFPALSLGPILEHLLVLSGRIF
ncbi:MAG: potassium-transporting ATPase subunit KdpA [Verrucomicrobia bacterium Tous-C9LFEB]|nr:MAG: potassium-transporting ATPase subunit KdpA [Verrucomicrobia bacterium Tous-C9LFEB]